MPKSRTNVEQRVISKKTFFFFPSSLCKRTKKGKFWGEIAKDRKEKKEEQEEDFFSASLKVHLRNKEKEEEEEK